MNVPNNISWDGQLGMAQWKGSLCKSPSSIPSNATSRYSSCSSSTGSFVPPPPPSDDSDDYTSEDDSSCTLNEQVSPVDSGQNQHVTPNDDEGGHFPSSKSSDSDKRGLDESNIQSNDYLIGCNPVSSMALDSSRQDYDARCSDQGGQPAITCSRVKSGRDYICNDLTASSFSGTSKTNQEGNSSHIDVAASNTMPSRQPETKLPTKIAKSATREHNHGIYDNGELFDDLIELLPTVISQPTHTIACTGSPVCSPSTSSGDISESSQSHDESSIGSSPRLHRRDPSADTPSYDSEGIEHYQWLLREKASILIDIAKAFVLYRAFDHWKCIMAFQRRTLERQSESLNTIKLIGMKIPLRLVLSFLKCKVRQRHNYHTAFMVLSSVILRTQLRIAFEIWLSKRKQYLDMCSALDNHISKIHVRLMQQCLYRWKVYTTKSILRRQEFFLMMVFNRWRLWTEDEIEKRENERIALVHWATALYSKVFRCLIEHARQNREGRQSSCIYQSRFISPPAKTIPNFSRSLLRNWDNTATRPLSKSYRSPQKSTEFNETPNIFSRTSTSRNAFQNRRRQNSLDEMSCASLPYQNSLQLDLQQTLSKDSNRIFDAFTTRNSYTGIGGSPSPFRNLLSSLNEKPRVQPKLSHTFARNDNSAFNISFSAPTNYATGTTRMRASCSSGGDLYSMSSPSVSSTKTLFKVKYEIASMLDEMVSIVEQRSKMHQCFQQPYSTYRRYAGYAGCNEELYNRL